MRPGRAIRYALRAWSVEQQKLLALAQKLSGSPPQLLASTPLFPVLTPDQVWEVSKLMREIEDAQAVVLSLFPDADDDCQADLDALTELFGNGETGDNE